MKILVINAGSSSLKYQLIDTNGEICLAKGLCERIGLEMGNVKQTTHDGRAAEFEVAMPNFAAAFNQLCNLLISEDYGVIKSMNEINATGHRVVHGGTKYSKSTLITADFLREIESLNPLAPLHNPANIEGIKACIEILGENVPQVAVFDTSFHQTMPQKAYMYAIPYELYQKYSIRRYGFHGTSHKFVAQKCAEVMGKNIEDLKIITCHLGNGSSIAAIKNGECVDTSMGFTPLDGIMMGTRSGAIDPSVVTFIEEHEQISSNEVNEILNKKSGFLGISGISSDNRDLVAAAEQGNARAALTIEMFEYHITKYIGAYSAAMGGLDAIVFTGGIGENVIERRANVCKNLEYLGVDFDFEKNASTRDLAEITMQNSKTKVFVIPTNEELSIARSTLAVIGE